MNTATRKRIQRSVNRLLVDTASNTVTTPGGSDGAGGELPPVETTTTVKVDVAPLGNTPEERLIAEQFAALTLWKLTFPAGTTVDESGTVEVNGQTYEIKAVLDGESDSIFVQAVATRNDQ